ncbi:MAG: hypothetical protein ACXVRX_06475 [Solirubrobacteraceae bacterium]
MCTNTHPLFVRHDAQDVSRVVARTAPALEVGKDVGYGARRRITAGPSDHSGTSIATEPPAPDPAITAEEVLCHG